MSRINIFYLACAIIFKNNKVLVARRFHNDDYGDKWEFPGGEIVSNENLIQCLHREITEELGIKIEIENYFQTVFSIYKGKLYIMKFFRTHYISGQVRLLEHSEYMWVDINKLETIDFAPVDKKIAKILFHQNGS